ncbi:uncharacterized protein LOC127115317 [Lathyrus oleraceus]|uniref:uncharacterized protein LOC127115317 n=1 Tax=Pisum sativum TaxID=3888 RepID=UPI0021CE5745|nr:uncharacterized protein LOC127115317 [Pisum sativum]
MVTLQYNGGSQKQTLAETSSNRVEVVALYEATKKCKWLWLVTQDIQGAHGLSIDNNPTILYEDNVVCVTQIKEYYIKIDKIEHITPKFFSFTQTLGKKNKEVDIQYMRSNDNVEDLYTRALPISVFKKHIQNIKMSHLRDQ